MVDHQRIILKNKCNLQEDCAICIESLYQKKVAYLPCKHFFHHSCLKLALEKKLYTCPLCRYDLVEALRNINFQFPQVYNPYVFNGGLYGLRWTYTQEVAEPEDDTLPELISSEDDSDDLTSNWTGLLLTMYSGLDTVPIIDPAYAIVPEPEPIEPIVPVPIAVDFVSFIYDIEITNFT
jgi:hypothetical protein